MRAAYVNAATARVVLKVGHAEAIRTIRHISALYQAARSSRRGIGALCRAGPVPDDDAHAAVARHSSAGTALDAVRFKLHFPPHCREEFVVSIGALWQDDLDLIAAKRNWRPRK